MNTGKERLVESVNDVEKCMIHIKNHFITDLAISFLSGIRGEIENGKSEQKE